MKLIIVRHGETVWNAEDKVQSLQHNSPFTRRGLRQIHAVAKKIKRIPQIDVVYTACLSRCIETVEKALAGKGDVPIILEQQLQQRNWGALAGMTRSEIGARYPESGYDNHGHTVDKNKKYMFRPPGGENWQDVQVRIRKFLDRLVTTYTKNETIIIFTHLAVSRALLSVLCSANIWTMEKFISYGNVNIFTIQSAGTPNTFRVYPKRSRFTLKGPAFSVYQVASE